MNAQLFLNLADLLANTPARDTNAPSAWRSAISRAYYAVYHEVLEFLQSIQVTIIEPHKGHDAVKQLFSFCKNPAANDIGNVLRTLHSMRWSADYRLDDSSTESQKTAET